MIWLHELALLTVLTVMQYSDVAAGTPTSDGALTGLKLVVL